MLTGYGTDAHRERAFDEGADEYLVKPAQNDELLRRIQVALARPRKSAVSPA